MKELFRRSRMTVTERDAERLEEIEALGKLANLDEMLEEHAIRRRDVLRRHREKRNL